MATKKPEEIVVNPDEVSDEMEDKNCPSKLDSGGPDSPDGVDGLPPTADADEASNDELDESGSESEEEEEHEREAMPEGDTNDDLHALLAFSKSRLEKQPQPPPPVEPTQAEGDEDATSDDENSEEVDGGGRVAQGNMVARDTSPDDDSSVTGKGHVEEKKIDADEAPPVIQDQAYFIELAMKKKKDAEVKAAQDEDPEYLRKVTEENVEQVAKANQDEVAAAENASKPPTPTLPPKPPLSRGPARSENQELWALLNYSKKRLETGATPQIKKRGSVRGDDVSVSSRLSKSSRASKRSLGSRTSASTTKPAGIAIEGGPGDSASPSGSPDGVTGKTDAPFPDVTDNGDASVDGSVSLESETKISDGADNSDDEEESSSDEEQEEEDELPDFLQDNDIDETDPEESRLRYEAAKFKAASILSVSEDNLTDLQMLQALAVAEDAARKGDDKFSTKRSLFKLNEAKIEDLKAFLSLATSPKNSQQRGVVEKKEGIGRGGFMRRVSAVFQDIKGKCDEIDEKKKHEREGQPSNKEMVSAALLDLKAQVAEYEKIVLAGGKKP